MPGHGTEATVDPTGTRRRIQALCFIGHTRTALAARMDTTQPQLTQAINRKQVPQDLADHVRRLYDELWNVIPAGPAAERTRTDARLRRWVSPLAWDDATIDDPAAVPDLGAKPPARREVIYENYLDVLGWGYDIDRAALHLGVSRDYLRKLEREHAAPAGEEVAA